MTLLIPVVVTIGLRLASAFYPAARAWGVNHLAYFSSAELIGHAFFFLLLFLFLVAAEQSSGIGLWLRRLGDGIGSAARRIPRGPRLLVVSAALLVVFGALSGGTHLLGDGALRMKQMRQVAPGDLFRTIVPEPIDYLLHHAIDRFVALPLGAGTLATFRFVSFAAGLFFFWTSWSFARSNRMPGAGAAFLLLCLLSWGGSLMFFGYAEEYALAAACMLAFFSLGLRFLDTGKGTVALAATFLLCFFLHNFTIVLLPSLLYAFHLERRRSAARRADTGGQSTGERAPAAVGPTGQAPAGRGRFLILLLSTVVPVVVWMAIVFAKRGPRTLLLPEAPSEPGYFIWSPAHLADMANEILLVSPAALLLAWLALTRRGKGRSSGGGGLGTLEGPRESESGPETSAVDSQRVEPEQGPSAAIPALREQRIFLWLAALASLLLLIFVDPQLGMARDWDLFSLPLLALHVALLMGVDWSRVGPWARNAVLVLSVSATSLWIVLNHDDARSLARCENIVNLEGRRARYGFAVLGDYYFVRGRYADAERVFTLSLQRQSHHDSYLGLAQAQAELGKENEAVESLKRTLELDPANPRALMLLGRFYYAKERWTEARDIFSRLLRTPEGRRDPNVAAMVRLLTEKIEGQGQQVP